MKKIIYICALLGYNLVSAQLSIGKEQVDGNSVILDFDYLATNKAGLILPSVTSSNDMQQTNSSNQTLQNGTLIYDLDDSKVKVREDDQWIDLSPTTGNSQRVVQNTSADIGTGAILGALSTDAIGVLVLESNDKAMILPRIFKPEVNVEGPYPGMICFDTASRTLAVFDGAKWNYWK